MKGKLSLNGITGLTGLNGQNVSKGETKQVQSVPTKRKSERNEKIGGQRNVQVHVKVIV